MFIYKNILKNILNSSNKLTPYFRGITRSALFLESHETV